MGTNVEFSRHAAPNPIIARYRFTPESLAESLWRKAWDTQVSNWTACACSVASNIATSRYTSVKMRTQQLRKNPGRANQPLMPLVGVRSFNLPDISVADYIELVDFTGRELHPGKRGKIAASEPKALTKLGLR